MRCKNAVNLGRRASSPARAAAASSGKLIWISAALNSLPANHLVAASSASIYASWLLILGRMKVFLTFCAIPRAIGLMKKGMGDDSTLSNTSFNNKGDMAEPSAKCSQYVQRSFSGVPGGGT